MADASSGRPKILVIDDEESMRELLKLHLRNAGYEVLAAEDAVAAGHLIVKHHPDLLILDVQMPYMSGYEFMAALKTDPETRDIPVLFLTTDPNVADEARRLGADAYLNKPVLAGQLLEVVAQLVKRST